MAIKLDTFELSVTCETSENIPNCNGRYHVLFESENIQDLPFSVLKLLYPDVCRILKFCNGLCTIPCIDYKFHCHCEDSTSMICQSRREVIKKIMLNISKKLPIKPPWTHCCSLAIYICFEDVIVVKCMRSISSAIKSILKDIQYDYIRYVRDYFIFKTSNLNEILNKIHALNIDRLVGFHWGLYDNEYWKSIETCELRGCPPCLLRFITVGGVEYQERYLKRLYLKTDFN